MDTYNDFEPIGLSKAIGIRSTSYKKYVAGAIVESDARITDVIISPKENTNQLDVTITYTRKFIRIIERRTFVFDLCFTMNDRLLCVSVPKTSNKSSMIIEMAKQFFGYTCASKHYEDDEPISCSIFTENHDVVKVAFSYEDPEYMIEYENLQPLPMSLSQQTQENMDPVERLVKESVENLRKHNPNLDEKALEAEAIYLAAFIYLRESDKIDFNVDYFSSGLLDKIDSGKYQIADKVFNYMIKFGSGIYTTNEANIGIEAYKMNIQLCSDYEVYIRNYFIRAHKIGAGAEYELFSSPRNCLWNEGKKCCDSPTQRDIYYKIKGDTFELMIPPFNPLITGRVVARSECRIQCQSNDNKRTFIFHYDGNISPSTLTLIYMFRNDKGDMISYHKK